MKSVSHPQQLTRLGCAEAVVGLDPTTGRLLRFHEPESLGVRPAGFKVVCVVCVGGDEVCQGAG
jgi:hypothetical protein